ncbi:hypothetical protein Slin15195_G083430 [Septoria linicola]|uniref:Uncharacterized protein n=1 Tax=Septoria linicola TaxID=215465 RepID=A0A9Q9ATA4_9PEZI|nr:hypothetical protein Slin14017_G085940 [Septoria linicola]USW55024.1 hypothetical protein Slin15195_G083430 [Septoria linicola]
MDLGPWQPKLFPPCSCPHHQLSGTTNIKANDPISNEGDPQPRHTRRQSSKSKISNVPIVAASQLRNRYRAPQRPSNVKLSEEVEDRVAHTPRALAPAAFYGIRTSQIGPFRRELTSSRTLREVAEWRAGFSRARKDGQPPAVRQHDLNQVNDLVEQLHLPNTTQIALRTPLSSHRSEPISTLSLANMHGQESSCEVHDQPDKSRELADRYESEPQSFLGDDEIAAEEETEIAVLKEQLRIAEEDIALKARLLRKIFELDEQRGTDTGDLVSAWLSAELGKDKRRAVECGNGKQHFEV